MDTENHTRGEEVASDEAKNVGSVSYVVDNRRLGATKTIKLQMSQTISN